MKNISRALLLLFLFILVLQPAHALAQEEDGALTLEVRRIFGFRLANRIQGRYKFVVSGPDDLERVEILVDGEVQYEIAEEPFTYEFSTSDFTPGLRTFKAVGYTDTGAILQSPEGAYSVLSAEEAQEGLTKYVIPLIVGIFVIVGLVGFVSSLITRKRGQYRIGEYGPAGGAVCNRCGMPFSRHVLSPNLVVGKLERCPNCGAVAIVRRGSPVELREAEKRLLADLHAGRSDRVEDEGKRLKRMIEDSRFDDL
jgi:hypothetical protein